MTVAVTLTVLAPAPALSSAPAATSAYVVVLSAGTGDPGAVAAEQAAALGFSVGYVYRSALQGYSADLPPRDLGALRADPRVFVVEADRPLAATAVMPAGIDRIDADRSVTAGIDDADRPRVKADVAVLDTGIDRDHADLNVVGGFNCAKGNGFDDRLGHGTHIAGIVGALDDGKGVVGVAPGVRLWAVRVLDDEGRGTTKELLCGVDWVTATRLDADPDNDIDVANLSLGGEGGDDGRCGQVDGDLLHQAICRSVTAGVTYVVAAGNDSADAAHYTPAAYDEVITVSALADSDGRPGGLGGPPPCRDDADDSLANFSNHGSDIDLVAPGVCILSTVPADGRVTNLQPGYGMLTGTSFAAPHVAGAAALWLAGHPGAAPDQVRQALVAAGSADWDAGEDLDGIKEPLLDVSPF
ncbi:MAG: S8 family serine peptidase [Acidimicrobiia bacterium]